MVQIIPSSAEKKKGEIKRVAAYVRVSSLRDEQEYSFKSQVAHFKEYINSHPGWELTKIYQDEGITGLNTKKRAGFKKMIEDAKHGAFDLVLVKSISRWGRNTIDSLDAIRTLQSYGVGAVFEKEALDTSKPGSEFILTIMASLAQAESISLSQNSQIGYQYKMQRGEHTLAYGNFLGYDKGENGKLVINPEQAETVRYIYDTFLSGMTLTDLARDLEAKGYKTGTGRTKWNKGCLTLILTNEKYYGAALLQKTYTADVLNKQRKRNDGSVAQYWIENDHEPIVSKQTALLAKGELMRRENVNMGVPRMGPVIFSGAYDFTKKLKCPRCGSWLNHVNSSKEIWKCYERIHGKCRMEIIQSEELRAAALTALQTLYDQQPEVELQIVPTLERTDSDEVLINAAVIYAQNTLAKRVADFCTEDRPEIYDGAQVRRLVETIEPWNREFVFRFYGGVRISVKRAGDKPQKGRRLNRTADRQATNRQKVE